MKKLNFVPPNDPILLRKAQEVTRSEIGSPKFRGLIDTLLAFARGEQSDRKRGILVGLAVPQVGMSKRIILVDVGADGHGGVSDLRVYINPEITWSSVEKNEWYEGCYSTAQVKGIVSRPTEIKIKAFTRKGKLVKESHHGYVARIFQHEIDHLNGKEFVTHIRDANKLHWVEEAEFPLYRDQEAWRNWPHKCPRERWEQIKGIRR